MEATTAIPGKNCYRDSDGKLHGIMMTKRKLTVIEIRGNDMKVWVV